MSDSARRFRKRMGVLLRLYPARHRATYAQEMLDVAEYRWDRDGRSVRAELVAVLDIALGAAGVWNDRLRRGTMGSGRGLWLDLRFVARSLWKSRGYVLTAVTVLACAVAANAAVFSYVRGTLLYEAPYDDPEDVMLVWGSNAEDGQLRDVISGPNYIDYRERARALEGVAAFHTDVQWLQVDGRPQVIDAQEVTVEFLDILGVTPFMGRVFGEQDRMSGAAETVVVTYAFWRDRMGSDPNAVGTTLPFDPEPRTVIGVLPEGFEFISPAPLFVPLRDDHLAGQERFNIHYNVIGRLAGGASIADANREARRIMDELIAEYPSFEGWGLLVEPLHEAAVAGVRPVILVLTGTVSLVLLVALLNLAMLFRVRAFARAAELDVRRALGAGRLRIARVLAIETVGLALVGGLVGLLATPFLLARVAELVPVWIAIPDSAARVPIVTAVLDPTVAATSLTLALVGAFVLNAPTFRTALSERSAGHRRRATRTGLRGTRALVGAELMVATVLCIAAGLSARSTGALLSVDLGIEPEGLLTMYFGDVWEMTPEDRTQYFRSVVDEVERLPGVQRAGLSGYVDFQAEDDFAGIQLLDRELQPVDRIREEWRRIDEGLLEAAGMRMVRGRALERPDFQGLPSVAVVNEAFAAKHYPGGDAIGQLLSTHNSAYRELRIVGIVGDVHSFGPSEPAPPTLYVPFQGDPRGTQGLHVRVDGDPVAYIDAVQEAVWSRDSSQPIGGVFPMSELVGWWIAIPRTARALVAGLAGLSWLLSALGVFGVVAYAVRTRRAEFGIRLALGASPRRLEADQLRSVAPVIVLGVAAGTALGVFGARAARAVLFGVTPVDPMSLGVAVTAMAGAALLASWLPARRAGRVSARDVIAAE